MERGPAAGLWALPYGGRSPAAGMRASARFPDCSTTPAGRRSRPVRVRSITCVALCERRAAGCSQMTLPRGCSRTNRAERLFAQGMSAAGFSAPLLAQGGAKMHSGHEMPLERGQLELNRVPMVACHRGVLGANRGLTDRSVRKPEESQQLNNTSDLRDLPCEGRLHGQFFGLLLTRLALRPLREGARRLGPLYQTPADRGVRTTRSVAAERVVHKRTKRLGGAVAYPCGGTHRAD